MRSSSARMGATMNPSDRDTRPGLAPASQPACYDERFKVSVALRHVLSSQWPPDPWAECDATSPVALGRVGPASSMKATSIEPKGLTSTHGG